MTRQKHVLALALALSVLVATVASSASARIDTGQQSKAATVTIWDFFVNSPKERAALMGSRTSGRRRPETRWSTPATWPTR